MSHTDKMRALLDKLDSKQLLNEGYRIIPSLDPGYEEREGLEGPINANGRPLYYDPKEGKYYDPRTDMYLDHDEALDALKEGARYSGLRRGASVMVKARGPYYGETGQVLELGSGGRHVVGGRVSGDQVVIELDSGKILSFNTEDLRSNDDQLDELSPKTLGNYVRGAADDINDVAYSQGRQHERVKNPDEYDRRAEIRADDKIHRRRQGIDRAMNCLTKEGQLDEISDELVNRTADARLDAVKSADRSNRDELMSKYDKFSKNQRLGARRDVRQQKAGKKPDPRSAEYQNAEPGRRNFGDSVECHDEKLDELSKDTLKSYGTKALDDLGRHNVASARRGAVGDRIGAGQHAAKAKRRERGLGRASDRLSEAEGSNIETLQNIVANHQATKVRFADGSAQMVDVQTADVILKVYAAVNPENQAKLDRMLNKDRASFTRVVDFCWSKVGFHEDTLSESYEQSIAELKSVLSERKKC